MKATANPAAARSTCSSAEAEDSRLVLGSAKVAVQRLR